MKVLYLYTEVMGYNIPIFECLVQRYGATVDVVHWSTNKNTPYVPTASEQSICFHARESFTPDTLRDFVAALKPNLVYTSGWQDKGYRPALKLLKASGVPVVMGLDSQWTNSLRQLVGARLMRYVFKKRYFNYAWVPGPLQYECAARLGFETGEILANLLTGNTKVFGKAASALQDEKVKSYPKRFLYVGRLTESKGIDLLIDAFRIYRSTYKGDWSLTCVGNGPLEAKLCHEPGIEVLPFADQEELSDLASQAGALVLPSRYEPWGVVVHEFASAGLPLLLSDKVGAKLQFLVDGLNGYAFAPGSANALAAAMQRLTSKTDTELIAMGCMSHRLSQAQSPEIAAASLLSVLDRQARQ